MTSTKINPYRKTYNIDIVEKLTENGNTYAKLAHYPAFMGSINVESDDFKINGKEPIPLKDDSNFYLVDKDLDYVEISLNWKKRMGIMQQNLGNALFRHFINESTDFEIINFKVRERDSYVDIKAKDLRFVTMNNLEEMTNYAISSNLKVQNIDNGITIEGLAKIFYEGPNLARTGEIALLIIRNVTKREDYLRISLVSGESAFKYAKNAINNLNNIRMYLGSNSLDTVYSDVKKLKSGMRIDNNDNKVSENVSNEKTPILEVNKHEIAKKSSVNQDKEIENKAIKKENSIANNSNSKENSKSVNKIEESTDDSNTKTKDTENNIKRDNTNIIKNEDATHKSKSNESSSNEESVKNLENAVTMFKNYATEVNGINYIYKILRDVNLSELKDVSTRLLKEDNFIQIYGIMSSKKSKIMIFRSQNLNFNLKEVYNKLKEKYNFSGSGNMFTLNIDCQSRDVVELMETFLIEIRRSLN